MHLYYLSGVMQVSDGKTVERNAIPLYRAFSLSFAAWNTRSNIGSVSLPVDMVC